MDNFFLGLRAVLLGSKDMLSRVTAYPLFWGFAMGFFTSTLVHAFLIMDSPRQVSSVLFNDKATSFQRLYPPGKDGSFTKSYSDFSRMADRVKIAFLSALLCGMSILLIALLTK